MPNYMVWMAHYLQHWCDVHTSLAAHQWCAVKMVCICRLQVCYNHLNSKSVISVTAVHVIKHMLWQDKVSLPMSFTSVDMVVGRQCAHITYPHPYPHTHTHNTHTDTTTMVWESDPAHHTTLTSYLQQRFCLSRKGGTGEVGGCT